MANPLLVADDDWSYVQSLMRDPQSKSLGLITATSVKDAVERMQNEYARFSAIFLGAGLRSSAEIDPFRVAREQHPTTPLFILLGESTPVPRAHSRPCVRKPAPYSALVRAIRSQPRAFDTEQAIAAAQLNQDKLGETSLADEAEFAPIRASEYLSGSTSLFDLYVRLSSGKFLKILQAGDAFDADRVKSYIDKGVESFFLRKSSQESYVQYCDHLGATLARKEGLPNAMRSRFVLNQGDETLSLLQAMGVEPASMEYARRYVENVHVLVGRLRAGGSAPLDAFFMDVSQYAHGAAAALLGVMLGQELGLSSEKGAETVGLGCLLHDIGLQGMGERARSGETETLNERELAEYRRHPEMGAQILMKVRGIDHSVIQAVQQHHERRDRSGFPTKIGGGSINRIAEIVGACDEFLHLIEQKKAEPTIDVFGVMNHLLGRGFSKPLGDAFRKVFRNGGGK